MEFKWIESEDEGIDIEESTIIFLTVSTIIFSITQIKKNCVSFNFDYV